MVNYKLIHSPGNIHLLKELDCVSQCDCFEQNVHVVFTHCKCVFIFMCIVLKFTYKIQNNRYI